MADGTHIQWTEATWNPLVGCTAVSPGCDHCYAATLASGRLKRLPLYAGLAKDGVFTGEVRLTPERLADPLKWTKPRRVFVNSMSDLFHDSVPDDFIATVFAVMAATPQHTYQILTKRHGRMRSLLTDECRCGNGHAPSIHFRSKMDWAATRHNPAYVPGLFSTYHTAPWPLPNVWVGVSVENQKWADIRIPVLLDTPAAVRWISAEPLLGPIDLRNCAGVDALEPDWVGGPTHGMGCPHPLLDWVVAGGESGPGARPMHPDWARSLRDQCASAGVAFFLKQHGDWVEVDDCGPEGWRARRESDWQVRRDGYAWPLIEPHDAEDDTEVTIRRVGKKAAGRELDGRTHDDYPIVEIGASS